MFDSRGEADRSPGSMIIWGIGFLLIFLVLCAAIYMFVVKFLLKKGRKEGDEEQVVQVVVPVNSGDSQDSGAFEGSRGNLEPLSVKSVVESEVETNGVCDYVAPSAPNPAPNPAPRAPKSISLSKEELSSGISQADVGKEQKTLNVQNPLIQNPEIQNPQNQKSSSAEKIQNPNPPPPNQMSRDTDKKPVITSQETVKGPNSKEKIPESEVSGYQMSSQRSEVNNFNMIEAGRTPPTDSRIEMIELAKKDSLTPVATAIGSSETAVSMTTPPIQMKK